MKNVKKVFLFIASLLLINCANLMGNVSDGYYTSVNKVFKIKTPAIPKLSVQDGVLNERIFVDFYQSRGFWKKYGLYSIEWYKPEIEIDSDKAFYHFTKNTTSAFVKNNYGSRGTFNLVDSRNITVNDQTAYQFVADGILDNVNAVWVGTSIKFDNYIALISIIILSVDRNTEIIGNGLHGTTVQANIPWDKYNTYLHSFTKIKSQ